MKPGPITVALLVWTRKSETLRFALNFNMRNQGLNVWHVFEIKKESFAFLYMFTVSCSRWNINYLCFRVKEYRVRGSQIGLG